MRSHDIWISNSPLKLTYLKALLLKCQCREFPWESLSPHRDLAQTPLAFTTAWC